jgi:hypothetical protein
MMARTSIKCSAETRSLLAEGKREKETWDEYLRRLAQLERATRVE